MLLHRLAADLGDLPLEAAHPGFAGVVANDVAQGAFLEGQLALLQAVGLDLLRNQVLGGDIDLLVLGVARQADDFHPIQQGRRDVHRVRGAEEHHVGQVVVDFQVVIVEVVVLLRVEHLEQRRGGIPRMSLPILSISSRRNSGLPRRPWSSSGSGGPAWSRYRYDGDRGSRPRHVRRRAPCARTCDWWRERWIRPGRSCHAGRPHQARTGPLSFFTRFCTARYSRMRSLTSSRP